MSRLSLLAFTLLFSCANALATGDGVSEFNGQGKLVILRIVPGDKVAKLFVLGKKTAELDLKKDAKVLSVFLKNGATQEELRINNQGDFYEVNGLPEETPSYVLSIKTKVKNQIEDIKIHVQNKIP